MEDSKSSSSEQEDTLVKKTVERKKGLNAWQMIAIALLCLLIATLLAMLIYNLLSEGSSKDDAKSTSKNDGIVVKDEKNVDKGVDVAPTGETKDAQGNVIHIDSKTVNNTDISLTSDAQKAIDMETKGSANAPITVNGDRVYGEIKVDNGVVSYFKYENGQQVLCTVPKGGATITYGGTVVSDKVVNLMDSITYDSSGNVIFKDCKTVVSYDNSHNATITYTNNDGVKYGDTLFRNVTKTSDGIYYSDGEKLAAEYQDIFKRFDELVTFNTVNNNPPTTNLNNISINNQI